jgi:hypothetical protein
LAQFPGRIATNQVILFFKMFFFFQLSGLLVLGVGIWTYFSHGAYLSLLSVRTVTFPMLAHLTAANGVLIVVASVIGCVGIATENKCVVALVSNQVLDNNILEHMLLV